MCGGVALLRGYRAMSARRSKPFHVEPRRCFIVHPMSLHSYLVTLLLGYTLDAYTSPVG